MNKIIKTSILGVALIGSVLGIQLAHNNIKQDVEHDLYTKNSETNDLPFNDGTLSMDFTSAYGEEVETEYFESHAYAIFYDVKLIEGHHFNVTDDKFDSKITLYKVVEDDNQALFSSQSTYNNANIENGFNNGSIVYGDFEDGDSLPNGDQPYYHDPASNLEASQDYQIEWLFYTETEDISNNRTEHKITHDFTTKEGDDIEMSTFSVSTTETTATINYDIYTNDEYPHDIDPKIVLMQGDQETEYFSTKLADSIIVKDLEPNTTYSDWSLKATFMFNNTSVHEDIYLLPSFKTDAIDISESVDSISLNAEENSDGVNMDYRYSTVLNSDLSSVIDTLYINVSGTTKVANAEDTIEVDGGELTVGEQNLGTATIDKTLTNLSTSISIKYVDSEEVTSVEIDEESPISSFTQDEALDGITQIIDHPGDEDGFKLEGWAIALISIAVILVVIAISAGIAFAIVANKKKTNT